MACGIWQPKQETKTNVLDHSDNTEPGSVVSDNGDCGEQPRFVPAQIVSKDGQLAASNTERANGEAELSCASSSSTARSALAQVNTGRPRRDGDAGLIEAHIS